MVNKTNILTIVTVLSVALPSSLLVSIHTNLVTAQGNKTGLQGGSNILGLGNSTWGSNSSPASAGENGSQNSSDSSKIH
ncbi:MAG: hypothetical protein M3162_00375 [Thermoproteota archaeon]|nr:hypothetical protein [Thermoproteota archaeon]